MSMRRPQVYAGELVTPVHKGYKLECCDCGLVHTIDFYINKSEKRPFVQFRVWIDKRTTARVRRTRLLQEKKR